MEKARLTSECEECGGATVTLDVGGEEVRLALPDDAETDEAAAIATALGAHLHDRAVAGTASAEENHPQVDEWKLAGRLKSLGKRRWPDDVREGEEWTAAARAFY